MSASVAIPVRQAALDGDLERPAAAAGIVVFAHGSGSGRLSPRNRSVAAALNRAGLATLLFDLLTGPEEAMDEASGGALRFDIPLLAQRLVEALDWVASEPATTALPVGCFGASTGAAAALVAAAERPALVRAVVSRGGRPDLAEHRLGEVQAPTLLIVGGADEVVLDLNRKAQRALACETSLEVVPGATHLFEEPGALDRVADLAARWFLAHLPPAGAPGGGAG